MSTPNPANTLRVISELTQAQAAALIGVSLSTWKSWEAGRTPMPAKKATAFVEAVARMDRGLLVTPAPNTTGRHPQIQAGIDRLVALGRETPTPAPCYTPDDPFGQKRLAALRDEGEVKTVTHSGAKSQEQSDFEDLSLDGVSADELPALAQAMRQSVQESERFAERRSKTLTES